MCACALAISQADTKSLLIGLMGLAAASACLDLLGSLVCGRWLSLTAKLHSTAFVQQSECLFHAHFTGRRDHCTTSWGGAYLYQTVEVLQPVASHVLPVVDDCAKAVAIQTLHTRERLVCAVLLPLADLSA